MLGTLKQKIIESLLQIKHKSLTSSVRSTIISKNPKPLADELAPPTRLLHHPRDFNSDKIEPDPSWPTKWLM